jgi:hypothetical protein
MRCYSAQVFISFAGSSFLGSVEKEKAMLMYHRTARAFPIMLSVLAFGCAGPMAPRTARAEPPSAPAADGAHASINDLEKRFRSATALLYAQTEDGGFKMMCTATAFEKKGKMTRFVTAAHCVASDDTQHDRVEVEKTNWFITFDEPHNKNMMEAHVVAAGYQHRGDDFAVVEVELAKDVPLMPLAADDPTLGENISNFASPLGLGKQLFRGHVSMESLDRPVISGDINWKGATLLQMSSGPGSSGSSIVSQNQKGIVAFLVGNITFRGSPNIVAIPVSKFKKFWTEAQAGKYKWYKADGDDSSASADAKSGKGVKKLWNRIHVDGITYKLDGDEDAADKK